MIIIMGLAVLLILPLFFLSSIIRHFNQCSIEGGKGPAGALYKEIEQMAGLVHKSTDKRFQASVNPENGFYSRFEIDFDNFQGLHGYYKLLDGPMYHLKEEWRSFNQVELGCLYVLMRSKYIESRG